MPVRWWSETSAQSGYVARVRLRRPSDHDRRDRNARLRGQIVVIRNTEETMKLAKRERFGGAVLGVLLAGILSARAANYPDRPISLIEPYPPGSISDIGARVLAQQLSKKLGQPVRVVAATIRPARQSTDDDDDDAPPG